MKNKDRAKTGGRVAGTPNKITSLLKDAILQAAELAGNDLEKKEGLIGYLKAQAIAQPAAFMTLLGKVLPMQINADVTTYRADVTDEIMEPEEWAKQNNPNNRIH